MATNIIRDDDNNIVIESVGAAYDSGDFITQGLLHGVSLNDVESGADAVVQAEGEFQYAKAAGETWTEGDPLFFDAGNDEFSTTPTTDYVVRGYAAEDAVLAATTGKIVLCDGHYAAVADALAYDNSTSGLAATDVQSAIDEVEDRVDDLEADKMDLVATPTAGNLIEMDASGQGVDSGVAAADVQVLTVPTAAGNIATLDAAGALLDGGLLLSRVEDVIAVSLDRVRRSTSTAQSLADGVVAEIAFEDIEATGDVTVDATNKQFTIPATGEYAIDAMLTFATAAGGTTRGVTVYNGITLVADSDATPSGATPDVVMTSGNIYCEADDILTVKGMQDSGGDLDVTAGRFMVQRIQ